MKRESYCREEDVAVPDLTAPVPEEMTNEEIVQEAWQIVNDSFLDTGRHRWSHDTWLVRFNSMYPYYTIRIYGIQKTD